MPATRKDVRGTVWFGKARLPVALTENAPVLDPSDRTRADQPSNRSLSSPKVSTQRQSTHHPVLREIVLQDPWEMYEPCASIFYGRPMILARHRTCKMDFIHVQVCTVERSTIEVMIQAIDQHAHRSFPRLLNVLQHGKHYYFMWEPIEFSLNEVIASTCQITEKELAQIIWPVLKGLRFLRDQGRELASLTPRDILFTEGGSVKIAGVENSRKFDSSKADAMASNLSALVAIVERLMRKNGADFTWSPDALGFKAVLAERTSARSLDDLLRHPYFGHMDGEGGLTLLVRLVNKTAYHEVKVCRAIPSCNAETDSKSVGMSTR
ncbi:hypothetical protein Asppvi_002055 [Aspergillus pseudoviridinutans]|uniref:Protein kinase domain-containing protein n=1 Tax=Aspergillus pseudoviridinutans TaxID=1517512 RepID=A0A9P3BK19_9EURO|nr:uncharacterized protein Asppvi_002055 [Aspergillus pseudoviridinutans]GIJ92777.1 hypothetical protein Asppvi_002055 [Aspergillus pseudoviridinutans]